MAPRQRKDPRLPPGLRERDGYYSYTSPIDGREYGIGRDRRKAINEALKANALLEKQPGLVERITGAGRSWGKWCDEFEKILAEREVKPNTRRVYGVMLRRARETFPSEGPAASIGTLACSDALKAIKAEGKARTAQSFRSFLIDCFDRMIANGWRADNPARVTDAVTPKVKRARLPFPVFMRLYERTSLVWLRNAMALAIVTGQGREECSFAEFADVHDGGWWSERGKTGARIFIPLELRLDCFGMSLDDVVRQCRRTGIASHYLVHQTERKKGATLGKKMHLQQLTRTFQLELAKLNVDWGGKEPASFHEIRSLAGRLYKEQGNVNPQELLGHRDPRTTAIYTDGRGEWVRVAVRK